MCRLSDRYNKNPEIMWKQLGSQIVTLHVNTHQYHVLNEAAGLIFEQSTGQTTVEVIAQELAKRFNIDKKEAQEDTIETVDGMVKLGLLMGTEIRKGGYARPSARAVTENDFKNSIASGAVLACRSLLGA